MYGQLMAGGKQFVHCREVVLLSECPLSEVLLYAYQTVSTYTTSIYKVEGNQIDVLKVTLQTALPFHILLMVMAWLSSKRIRPKPSTQTERLPRGDTEIEVTVRRSSGILVL